MTMDVAFCEARGISRPLDPRRLSLSEARVAHFLGLGGGGSGNGSRNGISSGISSGSGGDGDGDGGDTCNSSRRRQRRGRSVLHLLSFWPLDEVDEVDWGESNSASLRRGGGTGQAGDPLILAHHLLGESQHGSMGRAEKQQWLYDHRTLAGALRALRPAASPASTEDWRQLRLDMQEEIREGGGADGGEDGGGGGEGVEEEGEEHVTFALHYLLSEHDLVARAAEEWIAALLVPLVPSAQGKTVAGKGRGGTGRAPGRGKPARAPGSRGGGVDEIERSVLRPPAAPLVAWRVFLRFLAANDGRGRGSGEGEGGEDGWTPSDEHTIAACLGVMRRVDLRQKGFNRADGLVNIDNDSAATAAARGREHEAARRRRRHGDAGDRPLQRVLLRAR